MRGGEAIEYVIMVTIGICEGMMRADRSALVRDGEEQMERESTLKAGYRNKGCRNKG